MYFQIIKTPGLAIQSFLLGDEISKKCIIIDPTRHIVPYIVNAQSHGFTITDILETHVHADFVSGAKELKHELNNKPRIWCSGMGGADWVPAYADVVVKEGMELKLETFHLKALHTPGHTPEHISWICYDDTRDSEIPWFVLTGDSLFVGSVGRPDLLGVKESHELAKQLYHTLFTVFSILPDFVEIYPSHTLGSLCGKALNSKNSSSLGYERSCNSYFKNHSEDVWIKNILSENTLAPPYFSRLKKMNLKGPSFLGELLVKDWKGQENQKKIEELFLIDLRQPEIFAISHLKNSLNIPFNISFSHWCGWMLPENKPLGFIAETSQIAFQAIEQIRVMGFDQEVWVICFDQTDSYLNPYLTSFELINTKDFTEDNLNISHLYLVDVRTSSEWNSGHIAGAHHIELTHLKDSLNDLPTKVPIAFVCKSGARASLAASLVEKQGGFKVMNVRGGMQAWKQAGLPQEITTNTKI
ncbi:MAG: rhodanese-like domain-containing protein [Parachlamydiaceae bacterium]|nr:rhodanese-like domain-containing protein [Parachlamydiaceae bacterium]